MRVGAFGPQNRTGLTLAVSHTGNKPALGFRENCCLKKGGGVDTGDPKTSTYECAGCGHTCTGLVAWRNHMKKKIRYLKCALNRPCVVPCPLCVATHAAALPPCSQRGRTEEVSDESAARGPKSSKECQLMALSWSELTADSWRRAQPA